MKCWNPHCDNDTLSTRAVTCPECHTDRPRKKAGASETVERRKQVEINGRMFNLLLCQHVDRGQECAGIAVFSPSTTGSGPWYCRQHDPTRSDSGRKRTSPPQGFQALLDIVKPKHPDPEAIAERAAIQDEAAA